MPRRIRASMLPAIGDCERRAIVRQYPEVMEGYEPRVTRPSIGALVGTATHKMVAAYARKMMTGDAVDPQEAALIELNEEAAKGVEWDTTTPRLDVAVKQAVRLYAAYLPLLDTRRPALVEGSMGATLNDNWELTGTVDLLTTDGRIDDLKTGSKLSAYAAQLGGYALLAESHGHKVTALSTTFLKRVPVGSAQPEPAVQEYDLDATKRFAMATVKRIIRDVEAFEA